MYLLACLCIFLLTGGFYFVSFGATSCDSIRGLGLLATYQPTGSSLVGALSGNLEGDIVWGIALDLKGCGREVVEVLVEQLDKKQS